MGNGVALLMRTQTHLGKAQLAANIIFGRGFSLRSLRPFFAPFAVKSFFCVQILNTCGGRLIFALYF